jgi:hypothetical protein
MKVRIYKSPDGNGKYLNKTGQFLEKAQKGKIVKDVLKYGKQLVMNFDEADKIQKATELAKAIDKSNRLARAAGAAKYGEGIKKAVTTSSKIHIKNPSYYQQILDMTNNISPSTRQFHNDVLKSINRSKGMVSQKQYNILKNIENGTFNKYQLGGVPDVSEMGYPGSNSEKKELSQDELVNIISNDLNNDIDEQKIAFKLANFYDVDPMEAINLVSQVKNYLIEQNDSGYEYDYDEDADEVEEEEEEVVEEEPYESQEEIDAAEDTQNKSFVTDMLLNEDEEDDDDEEKYGGQMAYGGLYKAQDGEEVDTEIQQNNQVTYPFNPTAPDIVFPEIETYLPYNMADMLNGTIDPATGTYYNHYASEDINENSEYKDEEEGVEKNPTYAEDEQYYEENNIPRDNGYYEENNVPENNNVYGDYSEGQIIDPALDPSIIQMKKGGSYKRNKKVYVNSILKLAKKAEGGEEKKSDEDPEAGDPTGAKIRKQKLNNFIGSLKKETEMFNLKQQAEQQYDQMMQQQQQQQQQPMPPQNQMMQNGGSREPRVARGNELRYRANQLKDFITGQNRRDREDNIVYYNVNDYPTTNTNDNGNTSLSVENNDISSKPEIGQSYEGWLTTQDPRASLPYTRTNLIWDGNNWISSEKNNSNNKVYNNNHPSYSIDVRKSNWLTGRPSKYKIDFYGYSPLVDIATGNNSGVVSQKPVVIPAQNTIPSIIATTINKNQTPDLVKIENPGLFDAYKDYNNDGYADAIDFATWEQLDLNYKKSLLPTEPVKEIITKTEVKPKETIVKTPIKNSVYKAEKRKNSTPTITEIKKNPSTIINANAIKDKTIKVEQKKIVPKKPKVEYEEEYVDPTFMERLGRFFDPSFKNGGYVDSENPDLYEFNYGGYDPTQQDMDYSNSIDTTDPYFQRGGGVRKFIENYFPGNILSPQRTYRNEIQRVYDPRTGKTVAMPIDMGRLSSIDVQKSRFWSGKPKKYTMYFNGSTGKPVTTSNNTSSQSGRDRFCEMYPDSPRCKGVKQRDAQWNTKDNLSLKSRMAIKKGERQNERNSRRLERQGLDEYGNRPGDEQGAIYNGDGKLVRDAEGNYYDRYNEKIPDKKRPSDMENWWQNDRYFKQNTKNNEPMSNEEIPRLEPLLVGQIDRNPSLQPIMPKYITDPNYQYQTPSILQDNFGVTPYSEDPNIPIGNAEMPFAFNNIEPGFDLDLPKEALKYKDAYNAHMEYNKIYNEINSKIESGQEVDPKLTQLLKDKGDVFDKLRLDYSKAMYKDVNNDWEYSPIDDDFLNYNYYEDFIDYRKGKPLKEKTNQKINYKYGGNLDMFIPRAENGFQIPLGPGDCPTGSSKNTAGDCVDFMGKVVKKRPTGSDFGNNTNTTPEIKQPGVMNETYKNPLTGEKPGVIKGADGNLKINEEKPSFNENPSFNGNQYAVDVENKSDRGKLAFGNKADTSRNETRLGLFNTGVDIADSLKRNIDSRKSENQMYENLSSNNLYASDPSRDRGDYDTNSGLYRPDDQGQMWDSRSKQFGGYIDEEEYYDPYVEEDEEDELSYANGGEKITYMSEDQIRAFMAEGGQVEFL